MGILLTKVTHGVCDPKELKATTSSSYILGLCSGLCYTRFLGERPRHQRRTQELASPKGGLLIQTTPIIICVLKTMKRQRRGCGVPKTEIQSVTQIPENSLDGLLMDILGEG
jgi:hypothetical protein